MTTEIALDDITGFIRNGSTVAVGGGGIQRKPMSSIMKVARSDLDQLKLITFLGGPDVDVLIGMGKVDEISYCFVGFDALGLAPNFRAARQAGAIRAVEYSEGTMLAAFEAGARNLPFLPTRFGLDTDLLSTSTCPFKLIECPFTGERLVAVPAIRPDVALIHVNKVDRHGNGLIYGDPFVDTLISRAARKVILTANEIVSEVRDEANFRSTIISRIWVDHYAHAPLGSGMTSLFPEERHDVRSLGEYQRNATDKDWLHRFVGGNA